MEIPLLSDIAIIFCLSLLVVFVSLKLKIPTILGFLGTGVLVGPSGFRWIHAVHEVEVMAEIGVILLLFTIGLELSFKELSRIKKAVLLGGGMQLGLSVVFCLGILALFSLGTNLSIFLGLLVALSSTAIVLRFFQERQMVESPHGKMSLGILIFQDIAIVPIMLLTPLLAGKATGPSSGLWILGLKILGILAFVYVMAKYVIPFVLQQAAQTRKTEVFLLCIGGICLSVAWLTSLAGLSLGLGAFLAGLIISESEYSSNALSNIVPFRDVFMSFFFVSIGMLLDLSFVIHNLGWVLLLTILVLLIKFLATSLAVVSLGLPFKTAVVVGLSLAQIGEFSFVLSKTGIETGLLSPEHYQFFLAVSLFTMAMTPLFISLSQPLAEATLKMPIPKILKRGFSRTHLQNADQTQGILQDHLVIIGYGLNGKLLAKAAKATATPYVILEMNPKTVRDERKKNVPIIFGDASEAETLKHAKIKTARVAVIAISDPVGTRAAIHSIRSINPTIYIIARTRFVDEVELLLELGANEVVPSDYETSIEIFTRVMIQYLIPHHEIEEFIQEVRQDSYKILRSPSFTSTVLQDLPSYLGNLDIKIYRVESDSALKDKSLMELNLREERGVTVIAIKRGKEVVSNPAGKDKLFEEDLVVVMGEPKQTCLMGKYFGKHFDTGRCED